MGKILFILGILVLLLVGALLLIDAQTNTDDFGEKMSLPYTHSSTKAVCDDKNLCMDYEIYCKNENPVRIRFTGAAVQFPSSWKDSRSEKEKELC